MLGLQLTRGRASCSEAAGSASGGHTRTEREVHKWRGSPILTCNSAGGLQPLRCCCSEFGEAAWAPGRGQSAQGAARTRWREVRRLRPALQIQLTAPNVYKPTNALK